MMQREDLHCDSTTDMPIVVENVRKHNLLHKTMILSLIFSDLKLGFFHPNIGEKNVLALGI